MSLNITLLRVQQSLFFLSGRRSELYKKAARLWKQPESLYSTSRGPAVVEPTLSKTTTVQSNSTKMTFSQEPMVENGHGVQNGIESRGFATKAVHAGSPHDPVTGAVIPSVSSNFLFAGHIASNSRILGTVSNFFLIHLPRIGPCCAIISFLFPPLRRVCLAIRLLHL